MQLNSGTTRVLPREISCFKLNNDGTYESCDSEQCSVYIDEADVAALWNPNIAKFIKETYGPTVGVMHSTRDALSIPIYNTTKFVLGG